MVQLIAKNTGEGLPPLPEGQMRCVVAKNGFFLERRTPMFTTSIRVPCCPYGLDEHTEACRLHFGRLPSLLARIMVGFFRAAYELHGGEAVLLLLYDPSRRRFRWHCPRQTVKLNETWSGHWYASLEIEFDDPTTLPPGFIILGDAHSHAEFAAYASTTDRMEERYRDGLHIVLGRLNRPAADVHADFLMDGVRFRVEPEDILDMDDLGRPHKAPRSWMDQIIIRRNSYGHDHQNGWKRHG